MKDVTTDTLIIGAGPAGLACAAELSKADADFMVVEKNADVGGLSRTYVYHEDGLEFRTDNGPHRFFSKNPRLYAFIEGLLQEKWITVERHTRQFIEGKFYDYPIKPLQALKNVGPYRAFRILFDYGIAKIQYGLLKKETNNFEDYVVANFGRTLGEFNMINYTEKIWGIPAKNIHPDWATQRIKGLNLTSVLKEIISRSLSFGGKQKKDSPKSLIDTFFYPDSGTGLIYDTIAHNLEAKGYQVLRNTTPTVIRHYGRHLTEAVLTTPNGTETVTFNRLVESIPVTDFIQLLDPKPDQAVLDAAKKLTYRNQVYVFLTINKPSITRDQWIYFPSKDVPFGRISEMKNFSKKMSPPDKTSIFVEYFCFEGDDVWRASDSEITNLTIQHLDKSGLVTKDEVRHAYVIRERNVYPVYDVHYKEFLNIVKEYLNNFDNLFYIGRPGRFRYNNQDHSLEMGFAAAESILSGKRADFDAIGAENEYYEKGGLPPEKAKKK